MNLMNYKFYLFFVFIFTNNLLFSKELTLKNGFSKESINTYLYTYPTENKKHISMKEIIKTPSSHWKKVGPKGFKKKNDIRIWWLKINVNCKKSGRYYLENQYPLLEIFEMYQVYNQKIKKYGNFGLRNPDLHTPKQKYPTFTLSLEKGKKYTFYIKLYKKFAIPSQPISLYSDKAYNELSKKDEREYGIIFGIIVVLIFMGLLTGLIFRLKIYFYYTVYMFSLGGILFVANGLFRNYIPNEYLLEIYFSMYYCIILAFFALYLILYKLFDIRKEFPILHRIIQWKVVATFLNMAINQTAFFCWPNYPLKLYEIGNLMLILYPLFLFGICFVMYKRYRSEKALYFLLLFTFTLVFTVFFSLLPFSFVSHNQLMVFRWIIVFEGIAVLLILHRDLYRSKIEAIELQKNLILEEKKSMENYLNGLLDERNRIAEELHDSVSANLSALVLKMKNENLQETNLFYFQELKKIQDDIRSTSHNLHPITLKNNNLTSVINNEIARLENYFDDVNFEFSYGNIEEFDAITQQHKEVIYFTCCELIQNALKHSKANKITIDLKINKEQLSIKVSDNGKGYSLNNSTEGIGLKTIYKRATSVHGNFTIQQNTQGMSHVFTIPFNYNKRK